MTGKAEAVGPGFNTTHWTMVLACGEQDDSPATQKALTELYQTYWYPLYAYLRRRGYSEHDAEDLVQSFCAHLQEKKALAKADPHRGKFRTFLLSSLQNFLSHEYERTRAQKRGGDREFISLDSEKANARYHSDAASAETPEAVFETRWAHTLLEQTLARLRAEFAARGKIKLFDGLASFLTPDLDEQSYQKAADGLGLPLSAIKTSVRRLRLDYRSTLREEIGRTVSTADEIDEELRHLRRVLASPAA
ncbi:MAG: sigma-70 family RNA polymerase sigma factor [Chthoniobacterales bacterium]